MVVPPGSGRRPAGCRARRPPGRWPASSAGEAQLASGARLPRVGRLRARGPAAGCSPRPSRRRRRRSGPSGGRRWPGRRARRAGRSLRPWRGTGTTGGLRQPATSVPMAAWATSTVAESAPPPDHDGRDAPVDDDQVQEVVAGDVGHGRGDGGGPAGPRSPPPTAGPPRWAARGRGRRLGSTGWPGSPAKSERTSVTVSEPSAQVTTIVPAAWSKPRVSGRRRRPSRSRPGRARPSPPAGGTGGSSRPPVGGDDGARGVGADGAGRGRGRDRRFRRHPRRH